MQRLESQWSDTFATLMMAPNDNFSLAQDQGSTLFTKNPLLLEPGDYRRVSPMNQYMFRDRQKDITSFSERAYGPAKASIRPTSLAWGIWCGIRSVGAFGELGI